MTNATLAIGSVRLKATDGLILAMLACFTFLGIVFQVEQWLALTIKNIAVGIAYAFIIKIVERAERKFLKFFLRVATVSLTYAFLFGAVNHLQMIIHGTWMDEGIISMEESLFGVQPLLWTQHLFSKPVTEWMMFSYVVYVPMYPILCGIVYYKHGELAMEDYFFTLGLANILCDIGFILYPVASPMYWPAIKSQLTVPLDGWVWTYFGELMRKYLHFAGGSIPSPHAAAGTVMWAMAYRYYRIGFWVLVPVMISLYISTFYGRYHYVTDAVVGVLVALLAIWVAPSMMMLWQRVVVKND